VEWHHIRVYYYARDKDALILEAVRPLFQRLAGEVAATSFTRHWLRGPHLRLAVRTGTGTFDRLVRPTTERIVGGYLARRPSTTPVEPRRDLPMHERLAVLEGEPGPVWPWYPDNSLRFPTTAAAAPPGDPAAGEVLADFLADTTDLAFRMIGAARGAGRLALAYHLLIATGCAVPGLDLARAFIAFRSHAETFLSGFPEGAELRTAWERHYRDNAAALVRRIGTPGAHPFDREWRAVLLRYQDRAEALAPALPTVAPVAAGDGWEVSPFHQRLFASSHWQQTQRSAEFLRYRLVLNLAYLSLTRIGIGPVERFLLCYLASRAVEDRYGVSAYDLVG